jgi:site-specific DNA recombinase
VLSNHFYIGEVKYKNDILPGEQPQIMDRTLFEAVRHKSLAQWSHRTIVRNKSDHLLTGLLFDDAGHRMIPTHATKAGVRYRYYVSTPVLHGEAPGEHRAFSMLAYVWRRTRDEETSAS